MERNVMGQTFRAIVLAMALCIPALGGEIVFTNGDKLTGKVQQLADGKLTIETEMAGTITVDLANVRTFSSDEPLEVHLSDGSVVKQPVAASEEPGTVRTQGGGIIGPQDLPLAQVSAINPPPPAPPAAPEPAKWKGSVKAGALLTRGNSQTDQVSVGFDAVRESKENRLSFTGQYLYGRQEDPDTGEEDTTTDNWRLSGKLDHFVTEKLYWYTGVVAERDAIAELDLRLTPSAGLGYQWVKRDDMNFNTEAGVAWVYEDFANADSNDYWAARFAYHFDKKINERVQFVHNVEYIPSVEDLDEFNLNADAGLRIGLTEKFFNELKVEWKHDSEPAPGAEKNDVRYVISLGYEF